MSLPVEKPAEEISKDLEKETSHILPNIHGMFKPFFGKYLFLF